MKRLKLILFCLGPVLLTGCIKLYMPEDWQKQNQEAIENVNFKREIGVLDSAQTWNVAQSVDRKIKGIMIEELPDSEITTKSYYSPQTKAGIGAGKEEVSVTEELADYLMVTDGRDFMVSFSEISCWAETTFGIYYYSESGERVEVPLFGPIVGKTYTNKDKPKDKKVSLNGGNTFGVYIISRTYPGIDKYYTSDVTKKFYSESKLNPDGFSHVKLITEKITKRTGGGKNQKEEITYNYYVCFEDGDDADWNDIKILLRTEVKPCEPPVIVPVDYDDGPWMLICEDLGNLADNDFNDVVFTIHRPNAHEMYLEYVATGATRRNQIIFNHRILGEIHQLLGCSAEAIPSFINTETIGGQVAWTEPVKSGVIQVDERFTMKNFYYLGNDQLGGFAVTSDGMMATTFGQIGYAPYIICVPGFFKWPKECTPIYLAYPEFSEWAKDHTKNTDWYLHPVEDLVLSMDKIKEMN